MGGIFSKKQSKVTAYEPSISTLYNKRTKKRQFISSAVGDIGGRPYQEDRHVILEDLELKFDHVKISSSLYVVIDGHGGKECAEFVETNFADIFCKQEEFRNCNYLNAFHLTFQELEEKWTVQARLKKKGDSSGACVLAALIVEEGIYVAWVGDCRMVGYDSNDRKHIQIITEDHKPTALIEKNRILSVGGTVRAVLQPGCFGEKEVGPKRVFPGGLAVSRSIGTIKSKKESFGAILGAVIATPDVAFIQLENGIKWLILGSDGLWDYYTNSKNLSSLIVQNIEDKPDEMCSKILNAIRRNTSLTQRPDNATILVIKLLEPEQTINMN